MTLEHDGRVDFSAKTHCFFVIENEEAVFKNINIRFVKVEYKNIIKYFYHNI